MPPSGIGRHAASLEEVTHSQTTDKDRDHRAPRSDPRTEQYHGTEQDSQCRGLTERARDKAEEGIESRPITHRTRRSEFLQSRSTRNAIDLGTHHRPIRVPHLLTRDLRRVGEEYEGTRQKCGVEDIHTRTTEDLLTEDHGEGRSQTHHPERGRDGHHHRNQKTRDEEALVDLMITNLSEVELNGQTDDIRNGHHRQDTHQTVEEGHQTLQTYLSTRPVATEQECGDQCYDYHDHRALHIVAVADMSTLRGGRIGNEQEGLKTLESRMQETELTPLGEGRLHFIYQVS